jgi:hypothetical protein
MTAAASTPPNPPGRGLPVLGELSALGRIALVATVVASLAAIVLDFGMHADKNLIFVVSAVAILGLAWVVGLSTERLGSLTGPRVGGILNATFGNIAELIIAFFALQAGLIEVVKASLTGSIIGNLLLVLGASILVGACATEPRPSVSGSRPRMRRSSSWPSSACSCPRSSRSRPVLGRAR